VKNNLWVRGINIPPLPSELNGRSLVILYDCSFLELEHLCKNFTGTFRNKASLTCDYNYLTTSRTINIRFIDEDNTNTIPEDKTVHSEVYCFEKKTQLFESNYC
jgi:hypothetical protein